MKRIAFSLVFLFSLALTAADEPGGFFPKGTYKYSVSMEKENSFESLGTAVFTMKEENGMFVSDSVIKFSINGVEMNMNQTITEKKDFSPVKSVSETIVQKGDFSTKSLIEISFNGKEIRMIDDGEERLITPSKKFYFGSDILTHQMIKSKFQKGAKHTVVVLDPSLDSEGFANMTIESLGKEKISYKGTDILLNKLVMKFKDFNETVIYCDDAGINYIIKYEIMNIKVKMVLDK